VVDSLEAKRAAEEDARNVVGVWKVRNHLKVRPQTIPADDVLEDRIASAFLEDPFLERWDLDIDATLGWVTLSGTVNTSFEKIRAETAAGGVSGVVHVINNIEFEHRWTWRPDWEILDNIEDQMWWSPFVDADEVVVTVDDGVATLTGEVDTWSERSAAQKNAFDGGAKDVRNTLRVKYRIYGPDYPFFTRYYYPPYYYFPPF
jgi:osmotically-inducible protein OsmY